MVSGILGDVPDEKLNQCRGFLVDSDVDGVEVKLEENTQGALIMFQDMGEVCDTVLVGRKVITTGSDICCRGDMPVVLVCSKILAHAQ